MKITKEECITAVLVEPLINGDWNVKNNSTCSVCAVGAVLRQKDIHHSDIITDIMNKIAGDKFLSVEDEDVIDDDITNQYYLHALSCYFEGVLKGKHLENKRLALVHFIEAFFPESFEIKVA